jgi:hypothetical protein
MLGIHDFEDSGGGCYRVTDLLRFEGRTNVLLDPVTC